MMDNIQLDTTTPYQPDTTPPAVTDNNCHPANSTQVNLLNLYQSDPTSPTNHSNLTTSNGTNDENIPPPNTVSPVNVNELHHLLKRIHTSTPLNVPFPPPLAPEDSITNIIHHHKFDGQPATFPSWIRKFRLAVQLAHWSTAIKITFPDITGTINTYDITVDFTKIPKTIIAEQATGCGKLKQERYQ